MLKLEGRAGIERDEAEAARLIRLGAEGRDRDAQYRLALLHGTGAGVEKSDALALEWLRKSAAQQQPEAEYLLAAVYARGLYGVRHDDKTSVAWLRRAGLQGHLDAQYAMGLAYAEGRGVERDASEAYGWMLMAARKGHPRAIEFVRRVQEGTRR
jgi:TPR repeat protein